MTEKLLTFVRGIVRPVTTLAGFAAVLWAFLHIVLVRGVPSEVNARIVDVILTAVAMALAFWFGQRKQS